MPRIYHKNCNVIVNLCRRGLKGGIAMSENLRFSVEESVWFQKGQEVSELISISLDPDIVIQEHDQYVSIRGALQLTGEYRIDDNLHEEEERDFASVRLVNEVLTREDGISELNHRFPVDITIPQDRVQSLDEVYVSIETFDYEIPKRGCLQIVADLSISGIQGVTQPQKEKREEEITSIVAERPKEDAGVVGKSEEEAPQVVAEQSDEEELELVRSSPPEEENTASNEGDKESRTDQNEVVLQNQEEVVLHNEEQEVIATSEQQDETDADLFVPFEVEARKEVYQEEDEVEVIKAIEEEEEEEDIQPVLTPSFEVKARHDNHLSFGSDKDDKDKKSPTAVQDKEGQKAQREEQAEESVKRDENDLLLTSIFGRDEVDDHTTMKICIVQNGDTLEKISERYEISVQQLVRVNSLNTDSVSEGQLLYIPVHVNH